MILRRQLVVCSAAVMCVVAQLAGAQGAEGGIANRWMLGVAADMGVLPDELSSQCADGTDGLPMIGAGIAVLFHARPWLVVSTDTRGSAVPAAGCKLVVPAPTQIGANQWASAVGRNFGRAPTPPLLRSAVRGGVETTGGGPLVRASVGGGLLWSTSPAPFATAALGLGSRGNTVRFYGELEASVARVRVNDAQTFYHFDSTNNPVIDTRRNTPVVLHPRWAAVHIGVELPLMSR